MTLPDAEALHAGKVLRLRPGDCLNLLDGAGVRAEALLSDVGQGRRCTGMTCRVVRREVCPEPALALRLYLAPPRPRLMGEVIRCATELGVRRVTPILCRFSVSRPDASAVAGWRQDAAAAAKQSGNAFLPALDAPRHFAEALRDAGEPGVFGAVPRLEAATAAGLPSRGPMAVWIGPEGGFAEDEEEALYNRGLQPLTVGPWILRVETAVPALLGCLWGGGAHA